MIEGPAYVGGDLGRKRDLTSVVVVERVAARRPEAADHLVVRAIWTWDPAGQPGREVPFDEVRATFGALPGFCAQIEAVVIDEGAEGGAVLPFCRSHPALTLKVRGFTASPESNMALWGALAARLHSRTLSLPRHDRLVAELRSLRLEAFALGSRWRVVDSSRQFHRDVSFALALAVWAAGETAPYPAADVGVIPELARGRSRVTDSELAGAEAPRGGSIFGTARGTGRFWRR